MRILKTLLTVATLGIWLAPAIGAQDSGVPQSEPWYVETVLRFGAVTATSYRQLLVGMGLGTFTSWFGYSFLILAGPLWVVTGRGHRLADFALVVTAVVAAVWLCVSHLLGFIWAIPGWGAVASLLICIGWAVLGWHGQHRRTTLTSTKVASD